MNPVRFVGSRGFVDPRNIRLPVDGWIFESWHGLCISMDVLRFWASFFVSSEFPFPLRFHIELHTRKSFGSGFEGARYKFDVDMDMESDISGCLVLSSSLRRSSSRRTFHRLSRCSFRWQNRLWFVHGFNLKIVRRSEQYAKKPARVPPNIRCTLYVQYLREE